MKNKYLVKTIVAIMLCISFGVTGVFHGIVPVKAATGLNMGNLVIKMYPCSSSHFPVYDSTGEDKVQIGTCYDTDLITLDLVGIDGYSGITYSTISGNRTKSGYCETKYLFANPDFTGEIGETIENIPTFTKADCKSRFGVSTVGDACLILGYQNQNGSVATQLLYSCTSTYWKAGWLNGEYVISDGKLVKAETVTDGNRVRAEISEGYYSIKFASDEAFALDIAGAVSDTGGNLQLYRSNFSAAQIFYLKKHSDGYYSIHPYCAPGLAIDVWENGTENGTNLAQYPADEDKDNQKFAIFVTADGCYSFQSKSNGLFIDVNGGIAENGINVQCWEDNFTAAQKFKLEEVSFETAKGYVIDGVDIGYQAGEYFTDNGKACTDHSTKGIHSYYNEQACNCICTYDGKSLGAVQCFGFARYVQTKLYGVNSFNAPSRFEKVAGSYVAAGRLTETKLKELVTEAGVGAHLRTKSGGHSMIITDITNEGFTIIQCNGSNNQEYSGYYACRIGTYIYTWDSYVNTTYGKRGLEFIEKIK